MARIKLLPLRPQHLRAALVPPTAPSLRAPFALSPPTTTASAPSPSARAAFFSSSSASAATQHTPRGKDKKPVIPPPTPFVPDVQTFLTLIGRDLVKHAAKFPTWDSLFTLTSVDLAELGIEPPRTRRYLLQWRRRFLKGLYGPGGDLVHVRDGKAMLQIAEIIAPPRGADPDSPETAAAAVSFRPRKYVVNVPFDQNADTCPPDLLSRVCGYQVRDGNKIVGHYAKPLKHGGGAVVTITEGMWEDKRGHKVDGGERRRTEIRYKRRVAERREARERGELPQ
ncbi:IGR protein motif-domain-containing protein [Durotheca rogersii]|uniref:IGR protein motif-domain-containing protein n=1 Tax=Durotheca rogersii TaxID=419775 RepID=UPI00221F3229|nr:IGR protein motif-domain-containing protein [Durotheca rogersii]KAI5862808.1 IGR protein motif-domain-containing protein [Durotheca rogersii]